MQVIQRAQEISVERDKNLAIAQAKMIAHELADILRKVLR